MLDEQLPRSVHPRLPGIQKQVVPIGVRPIGNRHAGAVTGHESADPNHWARRAFERAGTARRPGAFKLWRCAFHAWQNWFELATKNQTNARLAAARTARHGSA